MNKNNLTGVFTLCSADSYPSSVAFYLTVNLLHRSDREVTEIFYLKSSICRNTHIALKAESKPFVLRTTLRYFHNAHECMNSLFFSLLIQNLELFHQIRLEGRLTFNSLNVITALENFHSRRRWLLTVTLFFAIFPATALSYYVSLYKFLGQLTF